jgi:hypothetical protein
LVIFGEKNTHMVYIIIVITIVLLFYVYWNYQNNKNRKKYGEPEYFLKYILLPLKVAYPKHRKLDENKGRIKYVFHDDMFDLYFDFIYLPSKIQVSILVESNLLRQRLTKTCEYNIDEIQKCCNELVSKLIYGN